MNEIADELHRVASEIASAAKRKTEAAKQFDDDGLAALIHSEVAGIMYAVDRLHERVAELRQKPSAVQIGQWWSESCDRPARISGVFQQHKQMWASFGSACGWRPAAAEDDMLTSARWRYYGNGPEPQKL